MSPSAARPLHEVTHLAIRTLSRELGVVDTVRFLRQFGAGQGDYTAERHLLFENATLEELVEEARQYRTGRP